METFFSVIIGCDKKGLQNSKCLFWKFLTNCIKPHARKWVERDPVTSTCLLCLQCCSAKREHGIQKSRGFENGSPHHSTIYIKKQQLGRLSLESHTLHTTFESLYIQKYHCYQVTHSRCSSYIWTSTANIATSAFVGKEEVFLNRVCRIKITWSDEKTVTCETTPQPPYYTSTFHYRHFKIRLSCCWI